MRKKKIIPLTPSLTQLNFIALNRQLNLAQDQSEDASISRSKEASAPGLKEESTYAKYESGIHQKELEKSPTIRKLKSTASPSRVVKEENNSVETSSNKSGLLRMKSLSHKTSISKVRRSKSH